jgi:nucleoside transporter
MPQTLSDSTPIMSPPAPPAVIPRLSIMMFLEFAIQGAWLPLLFGYLHNRWGIAQETVGNILAVGAVGAMLSPMVAGQIADRYMNAERVMAICHFIAAAIVLRLAYTGNVTELYALSFLYGLFLTPTMALVNAISFRHLRDGERDFGKVRVWGTAGWIFSGIAIGQWLLLKAGYDKTLQFEKMADAMKLSAVLGVALGIYSFTLPPTPPARGRQKSAPAEAMKEILHQPLLTLFLLSFVVAAVHAFFFARAAEYIGSGRVPLPDASWINKIFGVGGAGLMTVGQISELAVLALMPLIVPRVPRKVLFAIGLTAYALRFFAFAYLPTAPAVILALALHGIVFGCFFFLVFITIDEYITKDVRSSAQNVFNLIIFGVGVILGNWFSGWLGHRVTTGKTVDWQTFYAVPGWITIGCLVVLLIFYPNRPVPRTVNTAAA